MSSMPVKHDVAPHASTSTATTASVLNCGSYQAGKSPWQESKRPRNLHQRKQCTHAVVAKLTMAIRMTRKLQRSGYGVRKVVKSGFIRHVQRTMVCLMTQMISRA